MKTCSVESCSRKHWAKGFCSGHYQRSVKNKPLDTPIKRIKYHKICSIDGCNRKHHGNGLCHTHNTRAQKGMNINKPIKTPTLTDVFEEINWREHNGYIYGSVNGKNMLQHRYIWEQFYGVKLRDFENIHHKNGIRNDNRIENLELWVNHQPKGQRVDDLVEWVIRNYPELVSSKLKDIK